MKEETISVLSLNILGIPLVTKKYRERLGLLIKETTKLNPDIICFQEAWMPGAKELLINSLKPLGFNHAYHSHSYPRFNGLLTISKFEIIEAEKESTKPIFTGLNRSFLEFFAGDKGFSIIKIRCYGENIFVLNVHLSSDFRAETKKGSIFYKAKVKEVAKLIKEINNLGREKAIIAGDFNFNPESPFYKLLQDVSCLQDIHPADRNIKTSLYNLFKIKIPKDIYKRDYIFYKNFPENALTESRIIWDKPFGKVGYISDHAALYAKFKFLSFVQ